MVAMGEASSSMQSQAKSWLEAAGTCPRIADLALASKARSLAAVRCTKGAFHVTMGLENYLTIVLRRIQLRERRAL